jgi:hypothetical protein
MGPSPRLRASEAPSIAFLASRVRSRGVGNRVLACLPSPVAEYLSRVATKARVP